ncbi:MAG: dimethyl sulfoxide reductase anchor subunit [Burkholderiales bacterium]|nr:dimethyl sulfoxide reductase anchor subunit [Burkholderiales bacterium]
MSYGPAPWVQRSWDVRAVVNFAAGGAGGGLALAACAFGGAGPRTAAMYAIAMALVGIGLAAVWAEIGRPWRALNVFLNPRTSWMSREAIAAGGLGLATLAAVAVLANDSSLAARWAALPVALFAALFVYCQGRILAAARGIPAWRSPATVALIVTTSLAEGAGLWWLAAAFHAQGTRTGLVLFGLLLMARMAAWLAWRRSLAGWPRVVEAMAPAGRVLTLAGTLAPLALIAIAASISTEGWVLGLAATAGASATLAGVWFKAALILRGAYNQGFAVPKMPVRGVRD